MENKSIVWLSLVFALQMFVLTSMSAQALDAQLSTQQKETFSIAELDELPSFPGGLNQMADYLNDHLDYPLTARENAIEGQVKVGFTVGPNGGIGQAFILEGLGHGCDEQVLKIVNDMPRWKAGSIQDAKVATKMVISIQFELTS